MLQSTPQPSCQAAREPLAVAVLARAPLTGALGPLHGGLTEPRRCRGTAPGPAAGPPEGAAPHWPGRLLPRALIGPASPRPAPPRPAHAHKCGPAGRARTQAPQWAGPAASARGAERSRVR